MSAILNTKKACERLLATLGLPTAYENTNFVPPVGLYLRTQFSIGTPLSPTLGSGYVREQITFQVFVCDVLNKGTANALQVAEQIRSLFYQSLSIQEGNNSIHIFEVPRIAGCITATDRLVVPVIIHLATEQFN